VPFGMRVAHKTNLKARARRQQGPFRRAEGIERLTQAFRIVGMPD